MKQYYLFPNSGQIIKMGQDSTSGMIYFNQMSDDVKLYSQFNPKDLIKQLEEAIQYIEKYGQVNKSKLP